MERGTVEFAGKLIPYTVRRSARRQRTISLRIEAGEPVVVAPLFLQPSAIADFVRQRGQWVLDGRARVAPPSPGILDRRTLPYRGDDVPVEFISLPVAAVRVAHGPDGFQVHVPGALLPAEAESKVRDSLGRWYAGRAADILHSIVTLRAAEMRLTPGRVLIRNQRTRWGSCAADGALRFNWRLALVAPDLLDYVVVHELAHLVRRDHSPAFWSIVGEVLPGHRHLRARLRAAQALDPFAS